MNTRIILILFKQPQRKYGYHCESRKWNVCENNSVGQSWSAHDFCFRFMMSTTARLGVILYCISVCSYFKLCFWQIKLFLLSWITVFQSLNHECSLSLYNILSTRTKAKKRKTYIKSAIKGNVSDSTILAEFAKLVYISFFNLMKT